MLAVTPAVFVFFLHLHPAVLKPDFHLSLGQTQQSGYLVPTIPWEVHVKQKLLFQFEDLVLCIGATFFSGGLRVKPVGRRVIWRQEGRVGGADRRVNALRIIILLIIITKIIQQRNYWLHSLRRKC